MSAPAPTRWGWRPWAIAWALWTASGGFGCDDRPSGSAAVYGVEVARLDGPTPGQERWARQVVTEALEGVASLDAPASGQPLAADVRYGVVDTALGGRNLRLEVELAAPADLSAELGRVFEATVELSRTDGTIDEARDLPIVAGRAAAVLDAKLVVARGESSQIARLLGDSDPEIVLLALAAVQARGGRTWVDAVLPLLEAADPRVAVAAVECMGRIGAPEHAGAVVAAARLSDRAHTLALYDALATLGGPQAEGFLAFAARNEDDPRLLDRARKALVRAAEATAPKRVAASVADPAALRGHR